jgi:hypothetical protein
MFPLSSHPILRKKPFSWLSSPKGLALSISYQSQNGGRKYAKIAFWFSKSLKNDIRPENPGKFSSFNFSALSAISAVKGFYR